MVTNSDPLVVLRSDIFRPTVEALILFPPLAFARRVTFSDPRSRAFYDFFRPAVMASSTMNRPGSSDCPS